METKKIVIFAGDHAGQEVMTSALKVLRVVEATQNVKYELDEQLIGGVNCKVSPLMLGGH